jgi:hypothetical protein
VFDLQTLAGAASLVCPRCGTRFQFRTKSSATTPLPVAVPVTTEPDELVFPAEPSVVRLPSRRRPSARRRGPLAVALVACVVFGGLLIGGLVWYRSSSSEDSTSDEANLMPAESNCRFKMPDGPWKPDDEARVGLRVNLALRRSKPSSGMALYYRDFKTRLPSDFEMIEEARRCLGSYFKPLEWERKPKEDAHQLGGQPALKVEFQGRDPSQVEMSGECYMIVSRGIGYWFFTWCPNDDSDRLRPEWEALRQGFALLDRREGWKEVPPETDTLEGASLPYRLSPVKAVWRKVKKDGYDPTADAVLLGRAPSGQQHAATDATVQVLLLPRAGDLPAATKAARAHYLQHQIEAEGYPETTLEVFKDKNGVDEDRDTAVGAVEGHITKLHVTNAESRERYVILAIVASHPEKLIVLVCDCAWQRREMWDPEFTTLLKSFQLKAE